MGFPGSSNSKESACNVRDLGSIPGSRRSPGEGNGKPLQYFCLENPMDRGAWRATVHGVAKSQTQLSDFHFCHTFFSLSPLPQNNPTQTMLDSGQLPPCFLPFMAQPLETSGFFSPFPPLRSPLNPLQTAFQSQPSIETAPAKLISHLLIRKAERPLLTLISSTDGI